MEGKRNALSELEDDLRVMGLDVDGKESEILDKAQRIIGELAKHASTNLIPQDCYGCGLLKTISKCKEIAAEGGDAM